MPSKVIIIVIEFMFLGINMFWALLRAHFNPRLTARAKMSLSRAQNIFMPANINSIVLLSRILILSLNQTQKQTSVLRSPFFVRINIPLFGLGASGFRIESGKLLAWVTEGSFGNSCSTK